MSNLSKEIHDKIQDFSALTADGSAIMNILLKMNQRMDEIEARQEKIRHAARALIRTEFDP